MNKINQYIPNYVGKVCNNQDGTKSDRNNNGNNNDMLTDDNDTVVSKVGDNTFVSNDGINYINIKSLIATHITMFLK